ncbi:MAG: hypothetical protein JXQ65_15380 [Candidatus Marinimicrobia bacterium]|nr:hypothetical protein [Candidatus Neomarinimicrobiota bacterium]
MKKLIAIMVVLTCVTGLFAGGIVTNLNQSAEYVRTLNRNASTGLDAVFYNPAGLSKLEDGLYLYLSNQSIIQVKGIDAKYPVPMNTTNFEGNTGVWVYPNIYLAMKMNKLTFSGGFMPIGGGGSAEYKDGLPSFESGVAQLVPMLSQIGVNDYKYEVSFEGSSVYMGLQAGVTYELNEQFSVYGGGRFVNASNSYEGYLKNMQVNPLGGAFMAPAPYFYALRDQLAGGAAQMQPIIDAGAGSYTLAQLVGGGQMTQAQAEVIKQGIMQAAGLSAEQVDAMNVATLQGAYNAASSTMGATGDQLAVATADKELEASQSGHGFCAIVGLNWSPNDDLNVGFRYESITKMTLKNDTKKNTTGVVSFDDGIEKGADMPALAALGISYKVTDKLRLETNFNYFFDPQVDWDGNEDKLDNCMEFGLAAEYALNEKFIGSIGFLRSNTSSTEEYRSDLDYGLDSNTLGFGISYQFSEQLKLDFGALNTFYIDGKNAAGTEEYYKTTSVASIGMSYKF